MRTGEHDKFLKERYAPPVVYDEPDDDDPDAAPLREGPRWERVLRAAAAVVVTLYLGLYAYDSLRAPRELTAHTGRYTYEQLLSHADAGRVVRVDDRGSGEVRWETSDGGVWELDYGGPTGVDVRAAVERQEYVRTHPGSVTYGPIERRAHDALHDGPQALLLVMLVVVYFAPRPRIATRWGWAWVVWSLVGVPLYLLFSGSWRRTEPPGHGGDDRRVTGLAVWATLAFGGVAVAAVGGLLVDRVRPDPGRVNYDYVVPAELVTPTPPGLTP